MKRAAKDTVLLAQHFGNGRCLNVHIITLSDRASEGAYEDRGGPRVRERLETFFDGRGIEVEYTQQLLSDDAARLKEQLLAARSHGTHVIFTTGGTGVGPRDNTPDVVLELADKTIPGIMELVRMKYGANKPCALLSRTVAAIMGDIVIYTLPGSTKGIDEYLSEILASMEHLLCVLHGLHVHDD